MNNSFKTLISIISIAVMLVFGYLLNDNSNLKMEIKKKDLVIVQLEGKVTDQQTKINLLAEDVSAKQTAIAALEEKARSSSLAAQEAVDRMIELAKIERMYPAEGPCKVEEGKNRGREENERELNAIVQEPKDSSYELEKSNAKTAAGKESSASKTNKVDVTDDSSSKKFIDLRNNIYSRFK